MAARRSDRPNARPGRGQECLPTVLPRTGRAPSAAGATQCPPPERQPDRPPTRRHTKRPTDRPQTAVQARSGTCDRASKKITAVPEDTLPRAAAGDVPPPGRRDPRAQSRRRRSAAVGDTRRPRTQRRPRATGPGRTPGGRRPGDANVRPHLACRVARTRPRARCLARSDLVRLGAARDRQRRRAVRPHANCRERLDRRRPAATRAGALDRGACSGAGGTWPPAARPRRPRPARR